MTRSPEASGAGRAIRYNLLFLKKKQKDFHYYPSCGILVAIIFSDYKFQPQNKYLHHLRIGL